jgi:DNA-binding MarR family transcriptional regulator
MNDAAGAFCDLFPEVYLRFCRRHDDPRTRGERLTPQQSAVLAHLTMSGPLTVGEMAEHFSRAQSVVSEIVGGLVEKRLLERMRDARDRRRTLVWLTEEARGLMARRREVLDPARVARAMDALSPAQRTTLVDAMRALVDAGTPKPPRRKKP